MCFHTGTLLHPRRSVIRCMNFVLFMVFCFDPNYVHDLTCVPFTFFFQVGLCLLTVSFPLNFLELLLVLIIVLKCRRFIHLTDRTLGFKMTFIVNFIEWSSGVRDYLKFTAGNFTHPFFFLFCWCLFSSNSLTTTLSSSV